MRAVCTNQKTSLTCYPSTSVVHKLCCLTVWKDLILAVPSFPRLTHPGCWFRSSSNKKKCCIFLDQKGEQLSHRINNYGDFLSFLNVNLMTSSWTETAGQLLTPKAWVSSLLIGAGADKYLLLSLKARYTLSQWRQKADVRSSWLFRQSAKTLTLGLNTQFKKRATCHLTKEIKQKLSHNTHINLSNCAYALQQIQQN